MENLISTKISGLENYASIEEHEEDEKCREELVREEQDGKFKSILDLMKHHGVVQAGELCRLKDVLDESRYEYKLEDLFSKLYSNNIECFYSYTDYEGQVFCCKIDSESIRNTAINISLNESIYLSPQLREILLETPIGGGLQNRLNLKFEHLYLRKQDVKILCKLMKPIKTKIVHSPRKKDSHEIWVLRLALKYVLKLVVDIAKLRPDAFILYEKANSSNISPVKGFSLEKYTFNQSWLTSLLNAGKEDGSDSSRTKEIIRNALK